MNSTSRTVSNKHCPICPSTRLITPEDDEYVHCIACGVVRTKYNYDGSQYSSDYAKNYLEYAKSPTNTPLNLFRLGLISRWVRANDSILDIGCCVGEFIRFAENHYRCVGFEPNSTAAVEARRRVRFSEITTHLNGAKGYKCVTLFDVLEHIQEPAEFLKGISTMLVPCGIIVLTTPNVNSVSVESTIGPFQNFDVNLRRWKHYKPKEHLFLHNPKTLDILLSDLGFEIIHWGYEEADIRPGNPNRDILTCVARKVTL